MESGDFSSTSSLFTCFNFWRFHFDPNKTHTRKKCGSTGLVRSVLPHSFLCFLHRLGDEAAHPLGGVLLHLPGHVGVGVQGEPRTVVAQDAGHRFGVHALLDRQSCIGVSQPVEGDIFGDSGLFQQGFVQPPDAVRAVESARHWGGEHDWVTGVFGVLLDEQAHRFFRQEDCPHRVGGLGLGHLHLTVNPPGRFGDGY